MKLNLKQTLKNCGKVAAVGAVLASGAIIPQKAEAQQKQSKGKTTDKPNILVIMGDDIGWFNPSCYNRGMMGFQTPNIDRIANEGAMFMTWYGQQSCTAGRAAFITGQSPIRTGLTKVGMPGAPIGISDQDPTVAELLKSLGYSTGQFGKNHLGDKDEFLPTKHGFDEFFGNLYHLNAEEEPEDPDYPKDPNYRKMFGPRGVLKCTADGKIEDTGPLTKKRMETVDYEFANAAMDFMTRKSKEDKPFFCYFNSTRMHVFTHLAPGVDGKTGLGLQADGMVEHDSIVGMLLKKLDELGLTDNTIVVYTTDNGAELLSWPDGGSTPFRGEKATNWEGGFRVPTVIRWPGAIKPGTIVNDICAHEDLIPTFCAAAGEPNIVEKCKSGYSSNGKSFKVHLDGYNLMPFLKGDEKESPRKEFFYWSDDGDLFALRYNRWKISFIEQYYEGIDIWVKDYTKLRVPKLYDLYTDPFERSDKSIEYSLWMIHHAYINYGAIAYVSKWMMSFKDFPPRQKPASFTFDMDEVMKKLSTPTKN